MIGFVIIGFLAGTISGMGIGGGALLIPALGMFFGISQPMAQSINLLYFIPTAAIAVVTHRKKGNIETKGLLKLSIFGLVGAGLGASIALWMDPTMLKRMFGFFLLVMGAIEILKKGRESKEENNKQGEMYMELAAFEEMKERFKQADVDAKIDMYISAEGLSQTQYRELLKMFPLNALNRLEEALA